jgi:Family of unknown function (DUF6174)
MKHFCLIGSLLFLFLSYGCKKKKDQIIVNFDSSKFYEMRQNWQNLKIENYSYTYLHQGCICFSNKYVIKNKAVVENETEPDLSICNALGPPLYYTIDQIFSLIEGQYLNPYSQQEDDETFVYCKEIKVTYDSIYFFPRYCEIFYGAKNITNFCPQVNHTLTEFKIE